MADEARMSSKASSPSTNSVVTTVRRPAWVPRSAAMPAVLPGLLADLGNRLAQHEVVQDLIDSDHA